MGRGGGEMEYEIRIIKREKNPDFEPNNSGFYTSPPEFLQYHELSFTADEVQFKAIRKAALEVL